MDPPLSLLWATKHYNGYYYIDVNQSETYLSTLLEGTVGEVAGDDLWRSKYSVDFCREKRIAKFFMWYSRNVMYKKKWEIYKLLDKQK